MENRGDGKAAHMEERERDLARPSLAGDDAVDLSNDSLSSSLSPCKATATSVSSMLNVSIVGTKGRTAAGEGG